MLDFAITICYYPVLMTIEADSSTEKSGAPEVADPHLTEEFLRVKVPRLIERFTKAIGKIPDFQRNLKDDFFNVRLTSAVSFRKLGGLYTVEVSQNQMLITKKEVNDVRKEAFERTTIAQGDLGGHILFERTADGKDIKSWSDTEQGYDNALTMLTGLMDQMDIITEFAIGIEDLPGRGRVQRPHYGYKPTNT